MCSPICNGTAAASMVSAGFTAVDDVFAGERNFYVAYGGLGDPEILVKDLGRVYEIMNTNIKRWSVGSPIQAPLDSLLDLVRTHSIDAAEVESVEVRVSITGANTTDNRHMPDISMQHMVACMLLDGIVTFESSHDEARMNDPKVQALRKKVTLIGDPELQKVMPSRQGIVTVKLSDGRTLRHHTRAVRGTAQNPMTRAEVDEKCFHLLAPVLGKSRSRKLVDTVWALEEVRTCGRWGRCCGRNCGAGAIRLAAHRASTLQRRNAGAVVLCRPALRFSFHMMATPRWKFAGMRRRACDAQGVESWTKPRSGRKQAAAVQPPLSVTFVACCGLGRHSVFMSRVKRLPPDLTPADINQHSGSRTHSELPNQILPEEDMRISVLHRTVALVALASLPFAAVADITIDIGAQERVAFSDGRTFDPAVKQAWGRAEASSAGGFAIFGEGLLACPLGTCLPGPTVPGVSAAAARADATRMTVGVFARGASTFTTDAAAEVSVRDSLLLGASGVMTFNVRIDLDLLAATGTSDAAYSFGITLGSGDDRHGVIGFRAADEDGIRTAQVVLDNGTTVLDLADIPSTFERAVSVPVLPGSVPLEIFASAHAAAHSEQSAFVDAFNSAWIGISGVSYTSLNGYAYPGFAAAVPEPKPVVLLLAGLALVMLARGRSVFGARPKLANAS